MPCVARSHDPWQCYSFIEPVSSPGSLRSQELHMASLLALRGLHWSYITRWPCLVPRVSCLPAMCTSTLIEHLVWMEDIEGCVYKLAYCAKVVLLTFASGPTDHCHVTLRNVESKDHKIKIEQSMVHPVNIPIKIQNQYTEAEHTIIQ